VLIKYDKMQGRIFIIKHDKSTKITLHEDKATGVASIVYGSNVEAIAFNIGLIASKMPQSAIQIMKLYDEVSSIQTDDPNAPDEDQELALEELRKFTQRST